MGFVDFPLTLGGTTRHVTALVVPSLGPDSILLDNQVMNDFGATLDWENQTLSLSSTGVSIPAVHRKNTAVPPHTTARPPQPADSPMSVAAVYSDAEAVTVTLCERVALKPMHESLAVTFTDCLPPQDCTVIIEPRILSDDEVSNDSNLGASKNVIIARTLSTWKICLNAVLSGKNTLTPDQQTSVLDLCAQFRPVLSLSMSELGRCIIAEATFPVPPGTRPVDRPPYRPNPRTTAVVDKCVEDMPEWGIIEKDA